MITFLEKNCSHISNESTIEELCYHRITVLHERVLSRIVSLLQMKVSIYPTPLLWEECDTGSIFQWRTACTQVTLYNALPMYNKIPNIIEIKSIISFLKMKSFHNF